MAKPFVGYRANGRIESSFWVAQRALCAGDPAKREVGARAADLIRLECHLGAEW